MITRLRRAAETLQRFGQGTRSSKRIRKTLVKLVQICMTLVQFSPDHGPAILSALSLSTQQQQQQQQQPQPDTALPGAPDQTGFVGQQMQQPMHGQEGHGIGHPVSVVLPNHDHGNLATFGPDDPFATFDMGMQQQYWTDANLDLFTDLVGVDTGLTAMLSG